MPRLTSALAATALLALGLGTGATAADPLGVRPGAFPVIRVNPVAPPAPYAPGFDRGVIVGTQPDRCVTRTCRNVGGLQNRPFHRGYYRNYFDLPEPTYGTARPTRGNAAMRGAAVLDDTGAAWCAARYRLSDNTFQPNNGPRRACIPRPD